MFSWLTGKNQKSAESGAMTGNGNSDGGGGHGYEGGQASNTLHRIVIEEPDADLNF